MTTVNRMSIEGIRQYAARLNNRGAEAYDDGDHRLALEYFRDALQVMHPHERQKMQAEHQPGAVSLKRSRTVTEQHDGMPPPPVTTVSADGADSEAVGPNQDEFNADDAQHRSNDSAAVEQQQQQQRGRQRQRRQLTPESLRPSRLRVENDLPFYSKPIVIDQELLLVSQTHFVGDGLCYAVVIFNLATMLCSEGYAVGSASSAGKLLSSRQSMRNDHKALALYENCCRLLFQSSFLRRGCTDVAMVDLLVMACYNNMALLRHEFYDFRGSSMLLQRLTCFAYTMRNYACNSAEVRDFMREQRSVFLLNALCLKQPSAAQAA